MKCMMTIASGFFSGLFVAFITTSVTFWISPVTGQTKIEVRILFIEVYSEVDSSSHFSRLGAQERVNDSSLDWLLIDEKRMFSRVRRGYEGRRFLRSVHAITYDLMYVDYDTAVQVKEIFLKEVNESGDYINAERTARSMLSKAMEDSIPRQKSDGD